MNLTYKDCPYNLRIKIVPTDCNYYYYYNLYKFIDNTALSMM